MITKMSRLNRCLLSSQKFLAVQCLETCSLSPPERPITTTRKVYHSNLHQSISEEDKWSFVPKRLSHTTPINKESSSEEDKDRSDSSEGKIQNGILPFASIPGPKPYPILGNMFLFTTIGGYPFERFWSTCRKLFQEYGPIVRVSKVTPKMDMVFVFQPEDTRQIFLNEGTLPIRPPFDILEHYRKSRPEWFTSLGLVPGNGPEWRRLRTIVQVLLKREVYGHYRTKQASVAQDFVTLIEDQFPISGSHGDQGHVIPDILPLLFRYTLEAVGVVALGTRLGCLAAEGDHRALSIISANEDSLNVMGRSLFKAPLHKIFPTKDFLLLSHSQDTIARIVKKELSHHLESQLADPEAFAEQQPFLASLIDQQNLTSSDIFLLLVEVFQGGIDATATTLAFCLYYLSRNAHVQETLYQEVKNIDLFTHDLQGLRYLRAVLQENFRLRPSAPANGRILQQDAVFSGYHVPAGTLVSSPPVIACHDKEVFQDPEEFQPQRWLAKRRRRREGGASDETPPDDQSLEKTKQIHPYTIVPFGHGARMCPGRRLAEQEIVILLIQLVKSFKIEQIETGKQTEVGQVMRLNMMPDAPIGLTLIPR